MMITNNHKPRREQIMEIMELAERVESEVNNTLGFDLKQALLVSVTDGLFGVELSAPLTHGDVYELLESEASMELAKRSEYVAIVTCGWAAPIREDDDDDNQVAPSQHPARRRVRLVVLANRSSVSSVLRFSDTPDEVVTDAGKATGSLADAIHQLISKTVRNSN
jgi:hypothetical protein